MNTWAQGWCVCGACGRRWMAVVEEVEALRARR